MSAPLHDPMAPDASAGHEERDVTARPIALAALGLAAIVVLVCILMQLLLNFYAARQSRLTAPASPLAGTYGMKQPPEPRLQTAPLDDLQALRAREDAALHGYAWVDRQAGVVRIPIERAIEVLADRGLPARGGAGGAR